MKKRFITGSVWGAVLFAVMAVSCKRESVHTHDSSPAFHIWESDQLTIPAEIDLPANLPNGNVRVLTLYAKGVQQYKAQVKAGSYPASYEWVFVAPKAVLFDNNNRQIGTHGAGPYWTLSAVDSIFAQQFSPAKTATPYNSSIPWLLLMPKTGKTATGIFANVDYIQRIATEGGKAPETPPASITDSVDMPYTAVYRFTKKSL